MDVMSLVRCCALGRSLIQSRNKTTKEINIIPCCLIYQRQDTQDLYNGCKDILVENLSPK